VVELGSERRGGLKTYGVRGRAPGVGKHGNLDCGWKVQGGPLREGKKVPAIYEQEPVPLVPQGGKDPTERIKWDGRQDWAYRKATGADTAGKQ